ncbi:hypothetical protein TELCIR_02758 [Teladorsagia circumcincta]|uniref:Laminin EGF-like protein n=1 Tax=Teladorsagia circumcincta TaxID=45464 RepID=A0A2G9UZP7_TELCI|nr:hypothetical protein TELCIR_02758 [Teladorsagia circumcincta]
MHFDAAQHGCDQMRCVCVAWRVGVPVNMAGKAVDGRTHVCEHNTCGNMCGRCCPGYLQKKWQPITAHNNFTCECVLALN